MFEKEVSELTALGAQITTHEIVQQPDIWETTLAIYDHNIEAIEAFLGRAAELGGAERTHIVFTGAGTSAYVGDTVMPYLRRYGRDEFVYDAIATTDIVSAPYAFLRPEDPTVLVSFARSGNSPESLAAVERAGEVLQNVLYLNITCAPEGKLAQQFADDEKNLTLLIPDANDQGFAMTGSYSCMELLSALVFDAAPRESKAAWVSQAAAMGREVVAREAEIAAWVGSDFNRITYLGSGSFGGQARECQLKILELTHGLIATSFDTSMGYRHGPKSFVDDKTLVFVLVSNDPYTRQYDLDILNEIGGDDIALHTVAIQQVGETVYGGETFEFGPEYAPLPAAYLALPYIMVAQTVSLLTSVKVGNTPDTPSPSGTVNRVVKGVTIHPLK